MTQNRRRLVRRSEYDALMGVLNSAAALDLAEDFGEMPCQHECCAPGNWDQYQALRQALHDAIEEARRIRKDASA